MAISAEHGMHAAPGAGPRAVALAGAGALGGALAVLAVPVAVLGPLVRAAMYLAVLLAAGAALYLVFVDDGGGDLTEQDRSRSLVAWGAVAGMALVLADLVVRAAAIGGGTLASGIDRPNVEMVLGGRAHVTAVVASIGLMLLVWAVLQRWGMPAAPVAAVLGVVLAVGAFSFVGHSATRGPRFLTVSADILHVATAALWVGGLACLAVAVRARRMAGRLEEAARQVGRFSQVMTVGLTALVVAGLALAAFILDSPGQLLTTAYGRVLLVKIALVSGIVTVAGYNHRRLVPAVHDGDQHSWTRLSRTIRAELVGLVSVVTVTATLVDMNPGA